MASVNKVVIIGNLGADPEVRQGAGGDSICTLSVATSERFLDRRGQQQEHTEWHRVVLFRRLAEVAGEYLTKGSSVYIEGKIKTRRWQDDQGQDRYTTEIQALEMKMLDRNRSENGARREEPRRVEARPVAATATGLGPDIDLDTLPF